PRIPAKTKLADLLIAPARHHRLTAGLPRRMIVQPPPRRGFRRGTRPGRGIHREHQRPASRPVRGQHSPQPGGVGPAAGQRRIPAAMPAAHDRLQRQPGQRPHRPTRAQHRIGQLKQRIRPRPQTPIPPRPQPPPAATPPSPPPPTPPPPPPAGNNAILDTTATASSPPFLRTEREDDHAVAVPLSTTLRNDQQHPAETLKRKA